MKLKGLSFADVAEFQEAVTDELKVEKEEFSAAFQKMYDRAKALYINQWSLLVYYYIYYY